MPAGYRRWETLWQNSLSANTKRFSTWPRLGRVVEHRWLEKHGMRTSVRMIWRLSLASLAQHPATVFDLRPLREILHRVPAENRTPRLQRLVYWADSYDAIVCYKN